MGVGEGWVDLDGSTVALHSTIDILHLLESVPHVTVGIGKVRMDPGARDKHIITPRGAPPVIRTSRGTSL